MFRNENGEMDAEAILRVCKALQQAASNLREEMKLEAGSEQTHIMKQIIKAIKATIKSFIDEGIVDAQEVVQPEELKVCPTSIEWWCCGLLPPKPSLCRLKTQE